MKRRVVRIGLLLLAWGAAGAIVNVAVAWACSLNHLHARQAGSMDAAVLRWWERTAPATFDHQPSHGEFACGICREHLTLPPYPEGAGRGYDVRRGRSGWPILSMEMSYWYCYRQQKGVHISRWKPESFGDDIDGFPLRPIWPGFATNTLFCAAILWLLFAAPFALRRHRRIKRGRCPACAYPVGASHVCTECGKLVAPKAMAV
jgi:hypothetical protein